MFKFCIQTSVCISFLLIFFNPGIFAAGDEGYVDSLREVIDNHPQDSLGLDAYQLLAMKYWGTDLDSAYQIGKRGLRAAQAANDSGFIAGSENILGVTHLYKGNNRDALDHFYKVLGLRERLGQKEFIAAASNNVAIAHQELGNYSLALEFHQRSLAMKEELRDSARIQVSLNNIGLIYENLKDFDLAREYYNRSLNFPEKFKDDLSYATNHSNIGFTYFKQGQNSEALAAYTQSLEYSRKIGDQRMIGVELLHFGAVYEQLEEFELANQYGEKALVIFEELGKQDKIVESWILLGNTSLARNRSAKALEYCSNALELAHEIGNSRKKIECQQCMAMAYKSMGRVGKALEMTEQFVALKDSMHLEEMHKEILRKDMESAFARQHLADSMETTRANELVRLGFEKELKRQQSFGWVVTLVGIFALGLALLFYMNYRRNKKLSTYLESKVKERTQELEIQNQQLSEFAFINAHHLRGPLAQIMGLVELIRTADNPQDREMYLDMLLTSSNRLDKVIHEIRDAVEGEQTLDPTVHFNNN